MASPRSTSASAMRSAESRRWACRWLNRPIGNLDLRTVLDGMRRFSDEYHGHLVTETLLVAGVNDEEASVRRTAAFVRELGPREAYLGVPTRPPAEPWVRAPGSAVIARAAEKFSENGVPLSLLPDEIGENAASFAVSTDPASGLLGIIAVHPMSESAVRDYLARAGAGWSIAEALLEDGRAVKVRYRGRTYLRASLLRASR